MKTFLLSIAFASTAMFSGLALATQPGNNGGGNGGCGVGQQTNGCGAQGGTGGAGGQGGNGLGVGVGVGVANAAATANAAAVSGSTSGAAVIGSGNSNVRNTNNNANVQGQSQSSRNSNRNTAEGGRGGNAAATGGAGGNSGGNTLTGGAVAVSVEGDKGDLVYAPAAERAPVATAYAAPLVSSNGTCMGSSSAGGQGAALGLSFGTTWTDTNCDIRYDAEALRAAGMVDAARARLCQKAEIKDAMAAAGTPCVDKSRQAARIGDTRMNSKGEIEVVTAVTANSTGSVVLQPAQYSDPIIRARLGLPPLK
jgi:hypothetical protein